MLASIIQVNAQNWPINGAKKVCGSFGTYEDGFHDGIDIFGQGYITLQYAFNSAIGTNYSVVGGTAIATGTWDEEINEYDLGFTFKFDETPYTKVTISANGYIVFGGTTSLGNKPISSVVDAAGCVSAMGADLVGIDASSEIRYEKTGTAPNQIFTIQWTNSKRKNCNNEQLNFQIKLYENGGKIEIVYGACTGTDTPNPTHPEIGLRSFPSLANPNKLFINRKVETNWNTSSAGSVSTDVCVLKNTCKPANKLTWTYTPVVTSAQPVVATEKLELVEKWYLGRPGEIHYIFKTLRTTGTNYYLTFGHCWDNKPEIRSVGDIINQGNIIAYIRSHQTYKKGDPKTSFDHIHFRIAEIATPLVYFNPFEYFTEKDPGNNKPSFGPLFIKQQWNGSFQKHADQPFLFKKVDIIREITDDMGHTELPAPGLDDNAWPVPANRIKGIISSPYKVSFCIKNELNAVVLPMQSVEFSEVITDNKMDLLYNSDFKAGPSDSYRFCYCMTNINTANYAEDRYWNTRLKDGAAWNGADAKCNLETKFPDGKYKLYMKAEDKKIGHEVEDEPEIVVDNFVPFVHKIEVREAPGNILLYTSQWLWDGANSKLNRNPEKPLDGIVQGADPTKSLQIIVTFSESMDPLTVYIGLLGNIYYPTPPIDPNQKVFVFDISEVDIPDNKNSLETIEIHAKDRAGNDLQSHDKDTSPTINENQIPQRQPDGTWLPVPNPGIDKMHRIKIGNMKMWKGTTDVNWDNSQNWFFDDLPTTYDNVIIPDVSPNSFPEINSPGKCPMDLIIEDNASIIITPNGNLATFGIFTNNGNLTILSDENGFSGSFADFGGITGTGTFEFHRNIVNYAPSGDQSGWHYISSPVSGFSSYDIFDYWLNIWDETTHSWEHIEGIGPCTPDTPVNLGPLTGWSIKYDTSYNCSSNPGTGEIIELTGPISSLNTGAIPSVPLTFTSGDNEGWNLLGNPYSCSIDPNEITWGPNTDQSVYMWDGVLNTYWSWASGVGPNIPPTQGFFVHVNAADNFGLSGNERIHDNGQFWFKSEISHLLQLKTQSTETDYYDVAYIRFLNEATPSFDSKWDAYKLLSGVPEVPQIYTATSEDILSINSMPETDKVTLFFEAGKSDEYTLEVTEANDFDIVILEDKLTGIRTDLLVESYTFNFVEGDDANRFTVHFEDVQIDSDESSMNIYSDKNNVFVINGSGLQGEVNIYNILGQQVLSLELINGRNIITLNNPQGIYIVKVKTNTANAVQTKKVYIK